MNQVRPHQSSDATSMIVVEHGSLCRTVIVGGPNLSNLSKSAMVSLEVGNIGALEKSNRASQQGELESAISTAEPVGFIELEQEMCRILYQRYSAG
jgi:hypothetical protein